jgi:hypothetical protein
MGLWSIYFTHYMGPKNTFCQEPQASCEEVSQEFTGRLTIYWMCSLSSSGKPWMDHTQERPPLAYIFWGNSFPFLWPSTWTIFGKDRDWVLASSGLLTHCWGLHSSACLLLFKYRPTLWLLLFQGCGLGCIAFVWALAYTASSPTTSGSLSSKSLQSVSLVSPQMALLIIPALGFGYVLPAVLMALPSPKIVTNNFQQLALVSWNLFPLLVFGLLNFLGATIPVFSRRRNDLPVSSP